MNARTLLILCLGVGVSLATFDSIVLPGTRFSVADCIMVLMIALFGFSRAAVHRFAYSFVIVVPLALLINAAIFFSFESFRSNAPVDLSILISGFVRPLIFVSIAIMFYGVMESQYLSSIEVIKIAQIAGCFLTLIVFLQFIGVFPSMYHNNPAFGEVGRFTVFAEGWRPTGLTNEASFVGIFLFFLFVLSLESRSSTVTAYLPTALIFAGCWLSTSRLSLGLATVFFIFQRASLVKFVVSALALPLVLSLVDLDRLQNLLVFDGDASTIERYGSFFAYCSALFDGSNLFGTGYLNSVPLVTGYLDPLVIPILGDRTLTAFSLPLQLAVELGPIVFLVLCVFIYKMYGKDIKGYGFCAVFAAATLTGIQNFIFTYIFIALILYERNSRRT